MQDEQIQAELRSDTRSRIRAELASDEKLLWFGQPAQGLRLRAADAIAIPFSLLWGGFSVYWEYGVLTSKAPPLFALWGIPFVLMGAYMIIGRFLADVWLRSRAAYGLSNQRVILLGGWRGTVRRSLDLRSLSEVGLELATDGSGSIQLGPHDTRGPRNRAALSLPGMPGSNTAPAFEMIPDARRVHDMIRAAQQALCKGA